MFGMNCELTMHVHNVSFTQLWLPLSYSVQNKIQTCAYVHTYMHTSTYINYSLYVTLLPVSREIILITTIFIQLERTNKWPTQLFILQSKVKVKVIVVTIIKRWLQQSSTVYIITYIATCILVVITCNHLLAIIYTI